MTNTLNEAAQPTDPEGSIFLPETERELDKYRLALLLGRGPGEGKTLARLEEMRQAADERLEELRGKVSPVMVSVAVAPEI